MLWMHYTMLWILLSRLAFASFLPSFQRVGDLTLAKKLATVLGCV